MKIKAGKISPKPIPEDEEGKLVWSVKLEPDEKVKLTIPYSIEYKAGGWQVQTCLDLVKQI